MPEQPRVVITGAGGGLGQAFAQQLANRKPRMLLLDLNQERAEETAKLVRNAGGEATALAGDVTLPETTQHASDWMQGRYGGTDLLINNAGVAAAGLVGEMPLSDWDWLLRINLNGVIYGCHAFVPRMVKAGSGAIINVASCAGLVCLPSMGAYNVSKAGVVSLSETLDGEVRQHGIRVSVLCPTFFPSHLLENFRTPDPKLRTLAERFFKNSHMDAKGVARASLLGLERGKLIVVPQSDGRLVSTFKRLMPSVYRATIRSSALQKRMMA